MFAQIWIKDNRPEILQFHEAQCRLTTPARTRSAYFAGYQSLRHFQSCENHNSDFG